MKAKQLVKLERVINSCETFEQLEVAVQYAKLMAKRFKAAKEVGQFAAHRVYRRAYTLDPIRAMLEDWRTNGSIDC